jgi:hypothetical protein
MIGEILVISIVLGIGLLFNVGCYLIQVDRYWYRVWHKYNKPDVSSVKELKNIVKGL